MVAAEKGLEPLAQAMKELEEKPLREKAAEFIIQNEENPELSVASVEEALQGAMDIIAEQVSQESENRAAVKAFYIKDGRILVKAAENKVDSEEAKKAST